MNMTYDEENYENISSSIEDLEEVDDVTKAPKRKIVKPTMTANRHPLGTERKKKQKVSSTTEDGTNAYSTEDDNVSSSAAQDYVVEESSTAASTTRATTSQRPRNKTKVQRTTTTRPSTTTTYVSTSSDYFTSEKAEDFSFSELPEVSSTTELFKILSTTTAQDEFDSKSVTIDATIIEPKRHHKHRQHTMVNSVNPTSEYDQFHRNVPADCYCEPEYER